MSKITNIIKGWKNLIIEDKILEPLFKQRFEICLKCPKRAAMICTVCGCVCSAKSHSPTENCPENRWFPIHYIDNDFEYVLKSELPEEIQQYFEYEEIELDKWLEFLTQKNREKYDN